MGAPNGETMSHDDITTPISWWRDSVIAQGLSARAIGVLAVLLTSPTRTTSSGWLFKQLPRDEPSEIRAAVRELREAGLMEISGVGSEL